MIIHVPPCPDCGAVCKIAYHKPIGREWDVQKVVVCTGCVYSASIEGHKRLCGYRRFAEHIEKITEGV